MDDVRDDPVEGAMDGITVVASIWGDATIGPCFINSRSGEFSEALQAKFNEDYLIIYPLLLGVGQWP